MKKVLYSALAIATAIAGVAATKVNANNHRVSTFYKLILTPTTLAQVTLTTNWTATTGTVPTCSGTQDPCRLESSVAATVYVDGNGKTRHVPTVDPSKTIIATQLGVGVFQLNTNSAANIIGATNKN